MERLVSHRWNPGFVVMRWRHLFWLMPLLGLVTAVAWSWMEEFKEISVSGSLEYRTASASKLGDEKLAIEGIAFMTSDRVLERASSRLAKRKSWWVNASVASLRARQTVDFDPARRMPAIRMTVTGRGKKATEDVWMAIYDASNAISAEEDQAGEFAKVDAANHKVLRLESELADLEQSSVTPESPEGLSPSGHQPGKRDNKTVMVELAAAREERGRAQMNLGCGMSLGGVYLTSPPHTPVVPALFGPMGMLFLHGVIGLGVGAVLAICLAYALEVLRPRVPEVVV